jgi:DNA polymerase-1
VSRIKECFVTRFPDGYIVNADFSQLEVVALAIVSQDTRLTEDIRTGMDMHTIRASELFNVPLEKVTRAQRQTTKQLSFQLSYGAGAKSMAESNKISKALAKKFIDQYYTRYNAVKRWQDKIAQEVQNTREVTGHTKSGLPQGTGHYIAPNGRKYSFKEYDWKSFDGLADVKFSPTEMKNYPIQGGGADIVAIYRSCLLRTLGIEALTTNILPINSVHDNVMFDCKDKESVDYCVEVLYYSVREMEKRLSVSWNMPIPLEFKIDVEVGKSWDDLIKLDNWRKAA